MKKLSILVAGILLSFSLVGVSFAGNWWEEDFNSPRAKRWSEDNGSGSWGRFSTHGCNPHNPWHVGVVGAGHPRRAGAQSFRFENRAGQMRGDCKYHLAKWGERTELTAGATDRPGTNVWYAWSVYHKDFRFVNGIAATHGQFKTVGGRAHQYAMFRMDANRGMVIAFDAFEGWSSSKVVIKKSHISNKWNDIRIHAKWSTGADGIFQVWVNGKLKVDRRGRNALNNEAILFRFGIYKSDTNRASNNHTQVVYYDEVMRGKTCKSVSQFMACPAGGGNTGTSSPTKPGAKPPKSSTGTVSIDDVDRPPFNDRFTGEIGYGLDKFSRVTVFNGNVFSFKNYHTFTAYKTKDKQGLLLGFSKNQKEDDSIIDPVGIGWLFKNTAFMVTQDNSLLGSKPNGVFDFKDPATTYIDLGYRKNILNKATLFADVIYAYGKSKQGEFVRIDNIHALGFESKLEYLANDKNKFVFGLDMPLHIEKGVSRFIVSQSGKPVPLNIDLVPAARESRWSLMHNYQLSGKSNIVTELNYTNDVNHRRGNDYLRLFTSYQGYF